MLKVIERGGYALILHKSLGRAVVWDGFADDDVAEGFASLHGKAPDRDDAYWAIRNILFGLGFQSEEINIADIAEFYEEVTTFVFGGVYYLKDEVKRVLAAARTGGDEVTLTVENDPDAEPIVCTVGDLKGQYLISDPGSERDGDDIEDGDVPELPAEGGEGGSTGDGTGTDTGGGAPAEA